MPPHTTAPTRLAYTTHEVAEMLGLSDRLIENYVADGRLSVLRFGRSVRIPATEVERLLTSAKAS